MPLVQDRQYKTVFHTNTYHLVERGEKPFSVLSDPDRNLQLHLLEKNNEHKGCSYSYAAVEDPREENTHRHFIPRYRQKDIRRRKAILYKSS